jgi:flagella basal body P-ring formation protein FlgA
MPQQQLKNKNTIAVSMKSARLFATVCMLLMFPLLFAIPATAATVDLTFRENGSTSGERILLGEIAEVTVDGKKDEALEQRPVTASPAPGVSVKLETSAVVTFLQQTETAEAINWQGPQFISVTREGITIDKQRLQQILAEYLANNLDKLPKAEIRFASLKTPPKFTLPKGKLEWQVIPSKPDIIGSSSFAIIFKINGQTVRNISVQGRIEALADVVTAAVTLHRGAIITAGQIKMTRQNLIHLNEPCLDAGTVIGMRVKRTITAGHVIDKRFLEENPTVSKGEVVKILAGKGPMLLSTTGIAMADGKPGEMIRVENISSRKLIYCRVNSPGIVTVEF